MHAKLLPLLCCLLTAQLALCSGQQLEAAADCVPQLPPGPAPNTSAPTVLLQVHRWVWIENLTQPDWGPRTEHSTWEYYFIRPGYLLNLTVPIITLKSIFRTRVSVVTDGSTLCMAGLSLERNVTLNVTDNNWVCNSTCFANFTSAGYTAHLPTLLLTDNNSLKRSTEYFAVDGIDPEERASYNCMGEFVNRRLSSLPSIRSTARNCPAGDMCLFNYDGNVIDAGCKSTFTFNWCVGNFSLCDYRSGRDCPICCRGNYCNRAVADEIYKLWSAASDCRATSLTMLMVGALGLLWLRSAL